MPLFKLYAKQMKDAGHLADLNNVSGSRAGGSCTAAAFLKVNSVKPSSSNVLSHKEYHAGHGKMGEIFPVREKSRNFKIVPESQGVFGEKGEIGSENNKII